jgi:hypothetical protein
MVLAELAAGPFAPEHQRTDHQEGQAARLGEDPSLQVVGERLAGLKKTVCRSDIRRDSKRCDSYGKGRHESLQTSVGRAGLRWNRRL